MSTFLNCHINAFNYFGGIPQSILYDNLKSVVLSRIGSKINYNCRFLDFASYYGFSPKVCNPRSGNEKGKVERAIRYIKNNFLSSYQYDYPQGDFEHVKASAMIWLTKTANQREHSVTHKIPSECFRLEEKQHMPALPEGSYDYSEIEAKPVNKDCLIKFDTNRYSVPAEYSGQIVMLKAYSAVIKIFNGQSVEIASHKRCYDKHCIIKNPEHYKALLEIKRKAQMSARREKFINLCPEADQYLRDLNGVLSNPDFHIEKILSLAEIYGNTAVSGAVARAQGYKAYGWEYIKNILLTSGIPVQGHLTNLLQRKDLLELEIESRDLSFYENTDHENTDLSGDKNNGK